MDNIDRAVDELLDIPIKEALSKEDREIMKKIPSGIFYVDVKSLSDPYMIGDYIVRARSKKEARDLVAAEDVKVTKVETPAEYVRAMGMPAEELFDEVELEIMNELELGQVKELEVGT